MRSEPAGGSGIGPARFAFVYAVGATAALTVLYFAVADSSDAPLWGAIAGLAAFVLLSTVVLYVVLRRHAVRLGASQTELLASLSRYRELFEASPDPMWVYDLDTLSFLAVNDEAVTKYGWSEPEFLTMSVADLLDPADVPVLMAGFRRLGPGPSVPGEWRHRTKRGAHVWVEVSAQSIEYEERRAGLAVARDVTDRHVAEEALVVSEHQLRLGFELSPVGMAIVARDGRITHANAALGDLVARGPRSLMGVRSSRWCIRTTWPRSKVTPTACSTAPAPSGRGRSASCGPTERPPTSPRTWSSSVRPPTNRSSSRSSCATRRPRRGGRASRPHGSRSATASIKVSRCRARSTRSAGWSSLSSIGRSAR